jgi:hypothetical protein
VTTLNQVDYNVLLFTIFTCLLVVVFCLKQREILNEKEREEDKKYMEDAMNRFDEEDGVRTRAR